MGLCVCVCVVGEGGGYVSRVDSRNVYIQIIYFSFFFLFRPGFFACHFCITGITRNNGGDRGSRSGARALGAVWGPGRQSDLPIGGLQHGGARRGIERDRSGRWTRGLRVLGGLSRFLYVVGGGTYPVGERAQIRLRACARRRVTVCDVSVLFSYFA